MDTVQVAGRLRFGDGTFAEGEIQFIPQRLWVECDGETYPTMAPVHRLVNGSFLVYLTRTDTEELPWMYKVVTPTAIFHIEITDSGPLMLKDLIKTT